MILLYHTAHSSHELSGLKFKRVGLKASLMKSGK